MYERAFPTDLLRQRAETTPQRPALVDTDTDSEWSYRELDGDVDRMAASLAGAIDPEETAVDGSPGLAVALPTRPEFVFAAHAAMRLGWQLVPLNTRLAPPELATRLARLEPAAVLCGEGTESRLAEATDDDRSVPLLTVDEPGTDRSESLTVAHERAKRFDPHAPEDTVLIMFTSGTTGSPKAVRLTPANLLSSAVGSAFRLGVTPDDRWLCCLPLYHMGGLAPVFRSTLYGTSLLLQREFEAEETATILSQKSVTGVSLVPTQLSRLLDAGLSAPALRTVLLGGAPASESLLERAADASVPVYPTYGLTETASQVATAPPDQWRDHPGTVGQSLLPTSVRIVEDGEPLGPGERGEIVVSGPTVTPGYLGDGHEEPFSEYGLHTGDVGYLDRAGRLWVLGRVDDTIITGGELVTPEEVATTLQEVPGIEDVAVVGIEDEEWGERVSALVVPESEDPGREAIRERIRSRCRASLADYKRPKSIRFVEAIPRTHSGTVDRERTRELLGAESEPL